VALLSRRPWQGDRFASCGTQKKKGRGGKEKKGGRAVASPLVGQESTSQAARGGGEKKGRLWRAHRGPTDAARKSEKNRGKKVAWRIKQLQEEAMNRAESSEKGERRKKKKKRKGKGDSSVGAATSLATAVWRGE